MHETFWSLLHDAAHWEFELFLMLLFDGVIFGVCWPFLRKHWKHHIACDQEWAGTTVVRPDPFATIISPYTDWSGTAPGHMKYMPDDGDGGWPDMHQLFAEDVKGQTLGVVINDDMIKNPAKNHDDPETTS